MQPFSCFQTSENCLAGRTYGSQYSRIRTFNARTRMRGVGRRAGSQPANGKSAVVLPCGDGALLTFKLAPHIAGR
jgi:hypothetical protein